MILALLTSLSGFLFAENDETRAAPAQRVIALAPHTVEHLFALGAGERIVATTDFANYPEAALAIPRVGGYNGLQIEKVFELQPDLILAWQDGNKAEDIERLESLGLPVNRSKIESIDAVPERLRELGEMLGLQERAEALAQQFMHEIAAIRSENARKPPVRFFYQLWLEPLKTLTPGSWVNETLRSCNGVNVFPDQGDSDYPQVSLENVLLKAPEVIIVPSHHGDVIASGERWKAWPEIPAVQHQHIYYIDGDLLHRPTLRVLEGMREVCRVFDRVRKDQASNNQITETSSRPAATTPTTETNQ